MDELRQVVRTIVTARIHLAWWKIAREEEPMTDEFELRIEKLREAVDALDLAEHIILDFIKEEEKC